MDLVTANAVIATAAAAVALFDKVAGQVVRFIRKTPESPGPPKEIKFKVQGKGDALEVERHGHTVQILRGEDLKNLLGDYYEHIRTYEASVRSFYELWKAVYPHREDRAL